MRTAPTEPLIDLLSWGTEQQHLAAVRVLGHLATGDANGPKIIQPLIGLVRSGTETQKVSAAKALGHIAERASWNNAVGARIGELGGIEAIFDLVRCGTEQQQLAAVKLLECLAKHDANSTKIVTLLIGAVRSGTEAQQARAAGALCQFASSKAIGAKIGELGGIEPLIGLVSRCRFGYLLPSTPLAVSSTAAERGSCGAPASADDSAAPSPSPRVLPGSPAQAAEVAAVQTLGCLAAHDATSAKIRQLGGIEPLVALVSHGTGPAQQEAAKTLGCLAKHDANRAAIEGLIPKGQAHSMTVSEIKRWLGCIRKAIDLHQRDQGTIERLHCIETEDSVWIAEEEPDVS